MGLPKGLLPDPEDGHFVDVHGAETGLRIILRIPLEWQPDF
jgi:hypothetical protein